MEVVNRFFHIHTNTVRLLTLCEKCAYLLVYLSVSCFYSDRSRSVSIYGKFSSSPCLPCLGNRSWRSTASALPVHNYGSRSGAIVYRSAANDTDLEVFSANSVPAQPTIPLGFVAFTAFNIIGHW